MAYTSGDKIEEAHAAKLQGTILFGGALKDGLAGALGLAYAYIDQVEDQPLSRNATASGRAQVARRLRRLAREVNKVAKRVEEV